MVMIAVQINRNAAFYSCCISLQNKIAITQRSAANVIKTHSKWLEKQTINAAIVKRMSKRDLPFTAEVPSYLRAGQVRKSFTPSHFVPVSNSRRLYAIQTTLFKWATWLCLSEKEFLRTFNSRRYVQDRGTATCRRDFRVGIEKGNTNLQVTTYAFRIY